MQKARKRFCQYLDAFADNPGNTARRTYPGLESRPWHDPGDFPLAHYLETHFAAIRAEILALDPDAYQAEAEPIDRTGNWDVLVFYKMGQRIAETCDACPVTMKGLDPFSAMRTGPGGIYVSRLRPQTHIAPHEASLNLRLRCHLGIVVPEGDCAIRVDGETRSWREGRCIVLDDHFEHEAWNRTRHDRLVLVVDMWHPDLAPTEIRLLTGLHRYR
ncbi:MAG: aspartyl/asparaginyl beta-hydroxylase domain-containing protein [Solirubrobacterales bacterium]|nr:aspartyl/asparaginyl beta-hydroxylase domain-containing protein [Solirubrobacterales bacterium]